jgi:hypothetical protein
MPEDYISGLDTTHQSPTSTLQLPTANRRFFENTSGHVL